MDCSLPGSSVRGVFQARILECVAISFSRGSSWPREWTRVFCIGRQILFHWAIWEIQSLIIMLRKGSLWLGICSTGLKSCLCHQLRSLGQVTSLLSLFEVYSKRHSESVKALTCALGGGVRWGGQVAERPDSRLATASCEAWGLWQNLSAFVFLPVKWE